MDVTLKKTGKDKTYIIVHRKIYIKAMSQLYHEFREITVLSCSGQNFKKFNLFYIAFLTDRGKESCPCIKCKNLHLLPRGITNFRKTEKLILHDSVTESAKLKDSLSGEEVKKKHSEFS